MNPLQLFLLTLVVAGSGGAGQDGATCSPTCTQHRPRVIDPTDCHRYYTCNVDGRPSDHSVPCGTGERFDQLTEECVPDDGCIPSCDAAAAACHYTCDAAGDLLTDPFDCNTYYYCHNDDKLGPFICPEERPFFNGRFCVEDAASCCRDSCVAYCFSNSIQIPDPLDCGMYYMCLEEGFPWEEYHFQCGPGKVMDAREGKCRPGDQCQPLCGQQRALQMAAIEEELNKIGERALANGLSEDTEARAAREEEQRYKASGST